MKSLVEEASSITKAIEKAWTRAGKPQSFSVKIFETPETGFLGFTKKSAKVGIFFEETSVEKSQNRDNHRNASHQERGSERSNQDSKQTRSEDRPQRRRSYQERTQNPRPQRRDGKSTHSEGQNRPQRRRDDRGQSPRPQRRSEERFEHRNDKQEITPEQKPTTPKEVVPSPLTTPTANIKRAPKISGRRFSGTKKSDSNE